MEASPDSTVVAAAGAQVQRPWGSYLVLGEEQGHKTKRITVQPGGRLSYQRHRCRAEHWFVVAGYGEATLNGCLFPMRAGDSLDIRCGAVHRVANPGPDELVLVEVQTGSYFGEDDIERLDDDYGRVT